MNSLRFYTKLYGLTHNYKGVPYWVLTPVRQVLRKIANKRLPQYFDSTPLCLSKRQEKNLIISLTSFPARIDYVYLTIESLLRQTVLPEKVLLWLSKEQFPSVDSLPERLLCLQNNIFEIRFVDGDLRSHKKYYYTFLEFSNSKVILADDDIIYSDRMAEELLNEFQEFPNSVICRYALDIKYLEDGNLAPYKTWGRFFSKTSGKNVFFGTGGGTLLIPSQLYKDVIEKELFLSKTPIADDIWMNAQARIAGLDIRLITTDLYFPTNIPHNQDLHSQNVGEDQNDKQLKSVVDYYKKNIGYSPFRV